MNGSANACVVAPLLAAWFCSAPVLAADAFAIAPDGNFVLHGRTRYLIGTILYHHPTAKDYRHTDGYADADAWIYETPPNRAYLERLGFDSVGGEVSLTWLNEFRPDAKVWQARKALDWDIAANWWLSGLPTIVDFTCARWSHGCIQYEEGREPAREAIPEGGAGHFMPYSLVTPSGRALYARMWRSGAEELKAHGAAPYAYELFNEPTYEEVSPASRAAFARNLEEVFAGDPAAMDAAWGSRYGSFQAASNFRHPNECPGLGVEWIKFRERIFASGIHLGAETIREVVPNARVCFQPLGASFGGVNVLRANRECAVVMTPTGGGTAFDVLLLRALADGKPIIDGETYLGHTRASHRAKLLLHYSRGLNGSYYFKWDRRLDDPRFAGPDGPARMAETFPYMALNPAATKADAFAGLLDARREISFVEDVMNPRERGIAREERAAFLFSMPTERLGAAAGHGNHHFARASAEALTAAHIPLAAVFEEQIPEGRLDGFRFLVASGIDATDSRTVPALLDWTARGGSLVVGQEAMELDEWGNRRALPETLGIVLGKRISGEPGRFVLDGIEYEGSPYRSLEEWGEWSVAATLPDGAPAVLERPIGNGLARFVAVRLSRAGEARLLANLASGAGVRPSCSATDVETGEAVDDLEVHAARGSGGATAFVLTLHGLSPRAIRFAPGVGFPAASLADASTRGVLGRDSDGAALLLMEPETPVVLRGSMDAARPTEPYSSVAARAPDWLAARRPAAAAEAFQTDPARMRFLDLRAVANRAFTDAVAGDGKGGWTDQGENCLRNVPWGVTDCNGVPFDFIRPDQNGDRACVMLRSEKVPYLPEAVRGIDVGMKAEALFFLHAGAWLEGVETEIMRYVVRYADGTSERVPVIARRDIDDWWINVRRKTSATARCRMGWCNSENRGFHVLRWDNPHPDRTIASIDIESACGVALPIVAAISAQLPDPSPLAAWRLKATSWGGAKTLLRGGGLEIAADDSSVNWSGARLTLPTSVSVPDPVAFRLAFEFNGGMSPVGTFDVPPPAFQIRVVWRGADGVERQSKYLVPEIGGGAPDGDPGTWQTASLPLRRLVDAEGSVELTALYVQFRVLPARRAGVVLRDLRVESAAAAGGGD